jgi:biopolymer transport protein ExbD
MIIKKEAQNYLYSRNYNDMKIKIKRNKTNNEDNLLPLVNIIFLLLIFFMLAGVIAKQKEMHDINLASAVIEEYIEQDKNILFINSVGEIVFNDIPIAFSELDDKLKSIKDKNIIIAADKNVTTGKLNKVLIQLNKNKITNVTLLSNER